MANIELKNLKKVYDDAKGTIVAVDEFQLSVDDGEFVVLVGPSGCGKSTILRLIAGLEPVTEGRILFGNSEVQMLNATARDVAMAFQNYALYPNMTAHENIEYGLKHSTDLSKSERNKKVEGIAAMMGIQNLLESVPSELSGGQKQRVALGRALVREPDVFLLDEPLSNLDAKLRSDMRRELQRIHNKIDVTLVYVTHDQTEAMTMADRIVVMDNGQIQQIGDAETLYDDPDNLFVATFIGSPSMNVIQTHVTESKDTYALNLGETQLCTVSKTSIHKKIDNTVQFGFRPEDVVLSPEAVDDSFAAEVVITEYQGNENYIYLEVEGQRLICRTDPGLDFKRGRKIGVSIREKDAYLFDVDSNKAIKTKVQSY